jgi:hypothetical protein
VARVNVGRSTGRNVQNVKTREDRGMVFLALKDAHLHLRDGANVLALEAHGPADALDFFLDPELVCEE